MPRTNPGLMKNSVRAINKLRAGDNNSFLIGSKTIWLTSWLLGLSASALAQSGTYTSLTVFPTPSNGSAPQGITAGPDGAMWFTEEDSNSIGRATTEGTITEYPVLTPNSGPKAIAAGPDGALWFTEFTSNQIGRITTDGVVTEYAVPTPDSGPLGITRGPDDAVWFVEGNSNQAGRITTAGVITEYSIASPILVDGGYARYIITGPDGALWITFAGYRGSYIVRMTTSGGITVYPVPGLPAGGESPEAITVGSDGAIWFAETNGNIFRVTTGGTFTEYPVPLSAEGTYWITAGPDGALWFTSTCIPCSNAWIGRITTYGVFTVFQTPEKYAQFEGIAGGPDGNVWFTTDGLNDGYRIASVARVPACALGFSASFADSTLTMNFNLGIAEPAIFNILLKDASGTVVPFSKSIRAVVPPQALTMTWRDIPDLGMVTVEPELTAGSGQPLCGEWTTVNTAP